jgi:hypothetical protein
MMSFNGIMAGGERGIDFMGGSPSALGMSNMNVSNMDLQKMTSNDRVQNCVQKYVNENHRVAL